MPSGLVFAIAAALGAAGFVLFKVGGKKPKDEGGTPA